MKKVISEDTRGENSVFNETVKLYFSIYGGNMERYSWKECEKEIKREQFKRKIREKTSKTCEVARNFWNRNKEAIVILTPVIISGIGMINKSVKRREDKKEEEKRERRVYDPSMGDWWDLKKPLTNNERLEMERRVSEGELRGSVLKDMGKLKK